MWFDSERAAETTLAPDDVRRVALDLQSPLLQLGAVDGIYVVVEDIPPWVRLSAGRFNGNDTWSLAPGELDGLQAILPAARTEPFILSARALTPDPCGYDYASTTATFEIIVDPEGASAVAAAAPSRIEESAWPRLRPAATCTENEPMAAEDRRLAAARAEWQAEEELRFARARAHWEATERERWQVREAELRARLAVELADAEARWSRREASRIAAVGAHWAARLVASQARWRADEEQRRSASVPAAAIKPEEPGFARCIASLAAPIVFACAAVRVLWPPLVR